MAVVDAPSRLVRQRDRATGSSPGFVRLWHAALVLAPALVIGALGYYRRWISDDGLIYTRTVREILAGNGPVFSPGERAETSTSTLWQWLLALASGVTQADPARLAVYGGLACTVAGVALAVDGTRRYHGSGPGAARVLVPGGVPVLLALPPVWDYATSGLETGLVTLWMGAVWWLLVGLDRPFGARPGPVLATAFVLGLGPLVRPDLALVTAVFLLAAARLLRLGWRQSVVCLAVAAALPVAYEIFRMGYYGLLQPLPALTKEAGASDWSRGLGYLVNFVGPFWLYLSLPLAAALVALVARRRGRRGDGAVLLVAPIASGLLLGLYVVRVGGDWMQARMLLPALFMLLLPVLVVPLSRAASAVLALLVVWAAVALSPLSSPWQGNAGAPLQALIHRTAADNRRFTVETTGQRNPVTSRAFEKVFADYVSGVRAAQASGRPTLLLLDDSVGFMHLVPVSLAPGAAYRLAVTGRWLGFTGAQVPLDARAVDQLSLAYPLGAHLALLRSPFTGHEKMLDPAWIIADYAAPGARVPGNRAVASPTSITAARHALQCGRLRELQESVRAPLTWSRFWSNLTGAVGRTSLRVPRDPVVAEQAFCGSQR